MSDQMALTDENSVEVVIAGGPNVGKTMMCHDVYFVNGKARLPRGEFANAKMRILSRFYQVKYAHEAAADEARAAAVEETVAEQPEPPAVPPEVEGTEEGLPPAEPANRRPRNRKS